MSTRPHSDCFPDGAAAPVAATARSVSSIFKACDIRGVVDRDWGTAEAWRIGGALGRMLRRRDQTMACVGGDFRRTTPALMQAVVEGLLAAGISVGDMGQAATPVVYFAGRHLGCPNVVVVTASHNPAP